MMKTVGSLALLGFWMLVAQLQAEEASLQEDFSNPNNIFKLRDKHVFYEPCNKVDG